MKNQNKTHKFGAVIAKYRKAAGITQAELAEKLELSNDAVSRLERGHIALSVSRLFELAFVILDAVAAGVEQIRHIAFENFRQLMAMLNKLDSKERKKLFDLIEHLIQWKTNTLEQEPE